MRKKIIVVALFCFLCGILGSQAAMPQENEINEEKTVSINAESSGVTSLDASEVKIEDVGAISAGNSAAADKPGGQGKSILNVSGHGKNSSAVSSSRPKNALEAQSLGWKTKTVTARPKKIEEMVKEAPKELKAEKKQASGK